MKLVASFLEKFRSWKLTSRQKAALATSEIENYIAHSDYAAVPPTLPTYTINPKQILDKQNMSTETTNATPVTKTTGSPMLLTEFEELFAPAASSVVDTVQKQVVGLKSNVDRHQRALDKTKQDLANSTATYQKAIAAHEQEILKSNDLIAKLTPIS